jgi:hypothetical protein
MTPEEAQAVQAHVESIAAILYANTDPEKLKTLEGIELSVRQHMLETVSPQVGIFLSEQVRKQQQVESAASKAALEPSASRKNKPKSST